MMKQITDISTIKVPTLFMLDPAPGWRFVSGARRIVVAVPGMGAHGQFPDHPALRSSFMRTGPGGAAGRNLGIIDMRQIAPTLAKLLGVSLPSARMHAVDYAKSRRAAVRRGAFG